MKKIEQLQDVRVEIVTTTFVASGRPERIADVDRFVATLNAPEAADPITLFEPAVRPLYRASDQLQLDAALLIRREEIVFANFEGPGPSGLTQRDATVLLLAPPFQIQGVVSLPATTEATKALAALVGGFFAVRNASVFDADGNPLGEGELIIVNGAAVQMTSATGQHIDVTARSRAVGPTANGAPAEVAASEPAERRAA